LTYLLDTSALIGWLERGDSSLPELLEASDTACTTQSASVSCGAGMERASDDAVREMRTNTLRFTVQRLDAVRDRVLPAEHFGFLTVRFSRKLSHNDYWIVASVIGSDDLALATEDRQLFDLATSDALAEALSQRAWVRPQCRLVQSAPIQGS
jgi:hypothetical protein